MTRNIIEIAVVRFYQKERNIHPNISLYGYYTSIIS